MGNGSLPVSVIGLGAIGLQTLAALSRSSVVKVVGVADQNAKLANQAGKEFGVPAFSDNRALLAQTHPAAVYLAVPPMAAPELIELCTQRRIHIWKEMPLARNLNEAAGFIRSAEQAGVKFAVGTQRRFAAGYRRAFQLRQQLGRVFLARGHYLFNWGPNLAWRGDKASAGGGALMELGYHAIDLVIWMLGLPDQVYGLSTCGRRAEKLLPEEKLQPAYDTDDTAAAILRYNGGLMATVVTTRSSGPASEELDLHGRAGSIIANSEACLLRDRDGGVLDRVNDEVAPQAVFQRQAEAFALTVQGDASQYECSARENLLNLAVIEAIYLSDRTAQPESPLRLLRNAGFSLEDCLALRPSEKPATKTK